MSRAKELNEKLNEGVRHNPRNDARVAEYLGDIINPYISDGNWEPKRAANAVYDILIEALMDGIPIAVEYEQEVLDDFEIEFKAHLSRLLR